MIVGLNVESEMCERKKKGAQHSQLERKSGKR